MKGGGIGFFGGRRGGGTAPALFISGQSNAGNYDTIPGTSDPRVTLTWTANGTVFTGPGAMALQNSGGNDGHSYEWQCASNMAAHFNSDILVGKTWGDGSTCNSFCRATGMPVWPRLRNMIANFATQCIAEGITQVAFIWDQGSSEALTINSALTPAFTTNTESVFASIRAIFAAWGIGRVRFYVMQQNSNFQGLPDIDTALLNSVRSQEAAIVAADSDAVLINCDDIVMASGYHYSGGQTNTIGARFAALIAADFVSAQPPSITPPTIQQIFPTTLLLDLDSRVGIAVATGQDIPLWTEVSGNGRNAIQNTPGLRPLYLANALGSIPGVQFDGIDEVLAIVPGSMVLPAPGTTPFWSWEITRPDAWSAGGGLWGAVGATPRVLMWSVTPNLQGFNGSLSNNQSLLLNDFNRIEAYFSNSNTAYSSTPTGVVTGDYVKVRDTGNPASGVNMGNNVIGDLVIGHGNATYAAITVLRKIYCNALPTKTQFDKLCGYYTRNYGTTCGTM